MKIAFIRARYNAHGGAERFAARAIRALAAQDRSLDVAVVARRWDAASDEDADVRIVRCDPFYVGRTWRDASFAAAVTRVVARERFDLVQSHERIAGIPVYRAGDGVHAAWLERRGRTLSAAGRLGLALDPHHRYLVRAERRMFEHPGLRAVICNSRLVKDEIAARFAIDPAKLVLIRNGVDLVRFHPDVAAAMRGEARARLDVAPSTPVFVLVGSGFERKGVATAIDALAAIDRTARDDAVVVVVGDDRRVDRYRQRAVARGVAPRVRFVGAVADPRPFLAAADAFLAPSLYDPFPNAALEAWAMGLPVVTSDASGAAELVLDGDNGRVVPAGDAPSLSTAMRAIVDRDAGRVAAMADAARRTALPLSLDALAAALSALYRRLLDAPDPDAKIDFPS